MSHYIVLDYSTKYPTERRIFGTIIDARKYAIHLLKTHPKVDIVPILDPTRPSFDTFRDVGQVARDFPSWTAKNPSGYIWLPDKGGKKKLNENGTIKRGY